MKNLIEWLLSWWKPAKPLIRLPEPSKPPEPPIPPPTPIPTPQPVLTAGVDLQGHSPKWAGGSLQERKAMLTLAQRICVEEKLSPQMTQDLLLTIYGESGFNQWCINLTTFDYGLCQFSKIYYLKEYKMTAQEAIDNPERCLRIMAHNFKAGRQSNWVAYKTRLQHVHNLKTLAA